MKRSKISLILSVLTLLLSAFLTLGIKFLFHACTAMEGESKPCVDAQNAVIALGVAMLVIAVLAILLRKSAAQIAFSLSEIVLAIIAMILPGHGIDLCMMASMHCRAVMLPAIIIISGTIAIVSAINALVNKGEG